jgi:hypothetical protein
VARPRGTGGAGFLQMPCALPALENLPTVAVRKQKKAKIFIRWQKLPYTHTTARWLGNHSLKANYYVNQHFSSFYTCIKISMTLEAWNTRMHPVAEPGF